MNNPERADRITQLSALHLQTLGGEGDPDDKYQVASILTDIMHHANEHKYSFQEALRIAQDSYREEKA